MFDMLFQSRDLWYSWLEEHVRHWRQEHNRKEDRIEDRS